MKSAVMLLALLAAAPDVAAQTPYIETFEVRLHNLDVVVSDKHGNPVRGLTRDDFVVVDDGANQPITNFAVYDAQAAHDTSVSSTAETATSSEAAAPPPRRVVFFIDELSVQRMARQRLFKNAKAFVDTMRDGDVAAVVRPTAKEKIVLQFTGDRAAIEQALKDAIEASDVQLSGSRLEVRELRRQLANAVNGPLRNAAKREYADAAARRVEHRLGQLRALTTSLAGVEGKKIVVMVSMGLSAKPGSEAWDPGEQFGSLRPPGELDFDEDGLLLEPDDPDRIHNPVVRNLTGTIAAIGQSAAASGVTIYALEPDVPLDLMVRADTPIPMSKGRPNPILQVPRNFPVDLMQNSETTLASLTGITGGRWFRGLSNIDNAFRQISEDSSFYYSLAYRATGQGSEPRRVTVSVRNRPDLRVRTKTAVMEKSTEREMSDLVVASLLYPRAVNELNLAVVPGPSEKIRGFYVIPLDVVIPMSSLTFLKGDAGTYVASFDLHFAAAGESRDFGSGGKRQQKIEITPEQYAKLEGVNYRYKTTIQVSPGRVRIAIGVLDTVSKLTGFRTVEVVAQ